MGESDPLLWAIVLAYLLFVFGKGVWKARSVHDADDFLVAGRRVGWFPLLCTMGATVIGGGASVGAIGKTYDWGVLMVLVSTGWYLHFLFSGLVVAPKFRDAKLYTVAGYFGHRFGEGPRKVVLVLSLLFSVFIVAAQMAAFGTVMAALMPAAAESGLVLTLAILIGGTLVVIYSTAGGLMAVIHTDIFQFIVLFLGFVVTLVFCCTDLGTGPGDMTDTWTGLAERLPDDFLSPHGGKGWLFLVTTFLAFLLGETFAPGYATRYCVGRSIRETRLGIAGAGAFLALTFPLILFGIAAYARLHHPDIDPQQTLPLVVKQLNHPLLGGMILGALLMAVMSSADSALNSATAVVVKDLFEHELGWRDRGDGRLLRLARICTALLGLLAILVAVLWPDIIGLLLLTYHLWAPAIILPVCLGVFSRNRSPRLGRHILITMLTATGATLVYRGVTMLPDETARALVTEPVRSFVERFDPSVFGVLVSILVFLGLRLTGRTPPRS